MMLYEKEKTNRYLYLSSEISRESVANIIHAIELINQEDDMIDFTNTRKQCPHRDEECKFCKLRRDEILRYASDCLPEYCVCDGKCEWMSEHQS